VEASRSESEDGAGVGGAVTAPLSFVGGWQSSQGTGVDIVEWEKGYLISELQILSPLPTPSHINMQALIVTEKGKTQVKEVEKPQAGKGEIVVKVRLIPPLSSSRNPLTSPSSIQNCAVALNPTDWKV